jgi:putative membrane protein
VTAQAAEGTAEQGWERLHPFTPLLRGGRFLLLLAAVLGQQGLRNASPEALALVVGLGVPGAVLLGYVAWRAMRYRVTPTELQVESGVLTKRSRRVPLARVQAVDVVRPFYARLLGLAELRLEVVGSADAEAPMAFLSEGDARALRTRLLDLAAGRAPDAPAPAPDRVLVSVPTGPLVGSTLLGPPLVTTVALLVVLVGTLLVDVRAAGTVLVGSLPLLFGVASFAVRRVLSEYGFTVAESPDGLRVRHGLLDTRSQTIPPGRVQAVRVREPLLWRPFGWVRVEVDVAGYSAGSEQQAATGALLPVAPRQLAQDLIARVLGAPLPEATRPAPAAARWRAPLQFRRLRVGLDARHLVATSGVLTTTTDVAPLAKVQSLRTTQGPYERRLGLVSLHVDTAGRRLPGAVVRHRSAADAAHLLADLTAAARAARL